MSDFLKFLGGLGILGLIHEAMSKFSRIKASGEHGGSKANIELERLEAQEAVHLETEKSVEENKEQSSLIEK